MTSDIYSSHKTRARPGGSRPYKPEGFPCAHINTRRGVRRQPDSTQSQSTQTKWATSAILRTCCRAGHPGRTYGAGRPVCPHGPSAARKRPMDAVGSRQGANKGLSVPTSESHAKTSLRPSSPSAPSGYGAETSTSPSAQAPRSRASPRCRGGLPHEARLRRRACSRSPHPT